MLAAARVTGVSLRADLEGSRGQNRRLQQRLRSLEKRLSQLEGASSHCKVTNMTRFSARFGIIGLNDRA
jgi:hypothetical protein